MQSKSKFNFVAFTSAALLALFAVISVVESDPTEKCQPKNETYFVSDSVQCDKYYSCEKSGKMSDARLCDDGFVFSEAIKLCEYPHNVDCSKRAKLQEPQSKGDPHCERMNGFYPFPPSESCSKFYHCLEGKAYEKTCPEGVIFDPKKGSCVHPDMSARPDCAAHTVLNFKCPNMNKPFSRLRFGDHDRFPHPTDCRKFFICLSDGEPRIGGCPFGKVFQPKTGFCDLAKKVPECKDYYKNMKDPDAEPEDNNSSSAEDNSAETKDNQNQESSKSSSGQAKPTKNFNSPKGNRISNEF